MRGRGGFQNRGRGRPFRGRGGNNGGRFNQNNTTPQRTNNQSNKSTPSNTTNKTPDNKKIEKSPAVKPTTQVADKTPNKQMKRERSRSPLTPPPAFKPLESPIVGTVTVQREEKEQNDGKNNSKKSKPEPATNSSNTQQNPMRHTGRPGEKKFSNKCRLFVANLQSTMKEDEVKALFTPFGEVSETYFNKDKGFGFIRLDYRMNAENAKSSLDKKVVKGRTIQVRYATHASAIELHGLDQFASNELIEQAMSQFGAVERAKIVCDERGKSRGYAIVEFEWKKNAQKVLDRFKDEMFVLGRLPKPVFAKPLVQQDDEDGITEESVMKIPGCQQEREFQPRFISPDNFEFQFAQKWRDLYLEEKEKKARLDQELEELRYNLELEMQSASREQDAIKIREELVRRQEELRQIEEEMQNKRHMAQMGRHGGGGGSGMMQNRNSPFENRGPPPQRGQRGPPENQNFFRGNNSPNQMRGPPRDMNLEQVGAVLANAGIPGFSHHGPRPGMNQMPPHQGNGILQPRPGPGMLPNPGPRGGHPMGMRSPMMGPGPNRGGGQRRY